MFDDFKPSQVMPGMRFSKSGIHHRLRGAIPQHLPPPRVRPQCVSVANIGSTALHVCAFCGCETCRIKAGVSDPAICDCIDLPIILFLARGS